MPLLFLLALVVGIVAGALLEPASPAAIDPRLATLLTAGSLALAAFVAVVAASMQASAHIIARCRGGVATGDWVAEADATTLHSQICATAAVTLPSPLQRAARSDPLLDVSAESDAAAANAALARVVAPAAKSHQGTGGARDHPQPEREGELTAADVRSTEASVRTAAILRLPTLQPCYRRLLAPEAPVSGGEDAMCAWFDLVLRERRRIAWHHLATALFVPLPAAVFLNAQAAKGLERRLSEEGGIDLPLVIEMDASVLASELGWARSQDWRLAGATLLALRAAPLAPVSFAPGNVQCDFVMVEAQALLAVADHGGPEGAAVAGWISGLAAQGAAVIVSGVRDPRIVPRLVGLGVQFATGPGIAAAGENRPLRSQPSESVSWSSNLPLAAAATARAPLASLWQGRSASHAAGCRELEAAAADAPSPLAARLREAGRRAARAPLCGDLCAPATASATAAVAAHGRNPEGSHS